MVDTFGYSDYPGATSVQHQTTFTTEQSFAVAREQVLTSALTIKQQVWQEAGNNQALQMSLLYDSRTFQPFVLCSSLPRNHRTLNSLQT